MLPFNVYLITDAGPKGAGPEADMLAQRWLPQMAGAGLKAVQIRARNKTPLELYQYTRGLLARVFTPRASATLAPDADPMEVYLNDRADIALSLGLAGVHLREDSLPLSAHDPLFRDALRFGVSTHTMEGALAAQAMGADFITFGPVFPTLSKTSPLSKTGWGDPVGLKTLEHLAHHVGLPIVALGGITPQNAAECKAAGASAVACIGSVWRAENPLKALNELGDALGGL